MNLDPLAEDYLSYSTYNYTMNDPIQFIDPDGKAVWKPNGDGTWTAEKGDSAKTLSEDAEISLEEADKLVQAQHGPNYIGKDGGVKSDTEVGDIVSIPSQVEAYEAEQKEVEGLQNEIDSNEATIAGNNAETDSLENVNERVQKRIDVINEIGYKSDFDDPTTGVTTGTLIIQTKREFEVKGNKEKINKNNFTNDSLKKENNKKRSKIIQKGYIPNSNNKLKN